MFRQAMILLCIFASFSCAAEEAHLANIKQLTNGGENAEAYFSPDGSQLTFQSTRDGYPCDQIYTMKIDGSSLKRITPNKGRTTCSYFFPDGKRILYSSTHHASDDCPPPPDRSKGYTWAIYPSYDIYTANLDGTGSKLLYGSSGYDAEATISPDGKKIVFTSDHEGDLELYSMDLSGRNVRRLTHSPGYDGGAFFSPDSKQIVFRAHHISDSKELEEYQDLLKQHLVKPGALEIYVMDADGTNVREVTHNSAANFCPYFHPDGKRIIFASNMNDPAGRNFDLYMIGTDGNGLERITFNPTFDGFPMFSRDGKKLVFASNRNAAKPGETNIFIADWLDAPSQQKAHSVFSADHLRKHVEFLASDAMKGRLTGSPEGRKAVEYIAEEFKSYGLEQAPGTARPFQEFEFTSGVKLSSPNNLSLHSQAASASYSIEKKDYMPTGFSDDASLQKVPVVFAGYGIRAPDLQYDDYASLDVKGKAVFVYRFGPEGNDPKSEYAGYYPIRYKAMTARDQGAAALFVLGDNEKDDDLLPLRADSSFGTAGIPVISVKRDVLERWLKEGGKNFPDPKNPHGGALDFDVPGITLTMECHLVRTKSKAENAIGYLSASQTTEETIVIGAHYDHLGLGMEGSLASKWGEVHNGADDNASGVAGLLELARYYAKNRGKLKRNLLFAGFGGEELGILGSSYFVKNPVLPLKNIDAMLNMDMIGRLRERKLVVGGVGTSTAWKELVPAANREHLVLKLNEDGYGPSDHSAFYSKDIPVLFFFTGQHKEYHTPADDPSTLQYEGMVEVLDYIRNIIDDIEHLEHKPEFVRVKGGQGEMAGRGFRVYLGTIPDYTEEVKGVKLSGVREGSPAEKAGLSAGDVIIQFGSRKIENIYDYTFALQEHKPDESVKVTVLRNNKPVEVTVILAKRAPTSE